MGEILYFGNPKYEKLGLTHDTLAENRRRRPVRGQTNFPWSPGRHLQKLYRHRFCIQLGNIGT